jgi:hypothetical protein
MLAWDLGIWVLIADHLDKFAEPLTERRLSLISQPSVNGVMCGLQLRLQHLSEWVTMVETPSRYVNDLALGSLDRVMKVHR